MVVERKKEVAPLSVAYRQGDKSPPTDYEKANRTRLETKVTALESALKKKSGYAGLPEIRALVEDLDDNREIRAVIARVATMTGDSDFKGTHQRIEGALSQAMALLYPKSK